MKTVKPAPARKRERRRNPAPSKRPKQQLSRFINDELEENE